MDITEIRFTSAGRIAITVLAVFIICVQQCNIHSLEKNLTSKPEPIVEHVKVYDTVKINPNAAPIFPEGTKFLYYWSLMENPKDSGQYTTALTFHKGDLLKLPVGKKGSIEFVKILSEGTPIKN